MVRLGWKTVSRRDASDWIVVGIRGVFALLFGAAALAWPGIYLRVLVLLFAGFLFLSGLSLVGLVIRRWKQRSAWFDVVKGALEIALAVVVALWPGVTAVVLLYVIGAWALATGLLEFLTAVRWRAALADKLLIAAAGLVSVGFGLFLVLRPAAGAVTVAWLIGIYALFVGASYVFRAYRLKRCERLRL
jgi:uncharacterized membrane protein HdeD (DUF308 family)